MRSLALACVLLVAPLAAAQTAALDSTDPSRGITLMPASAAWADEATALVYNPAGLTHVGKLNGWYLHEHSNTRGRNADSAFLATSLADVFGLGLGAEWLRPDGQAASWKGLFGVSVGLPTFSAGASFTWFNGGALAGAHSVDLGLQARPLRWLSLGGTVRNLTEPGAGAASVGREWSLAVGLRPLHERVSVGVDWVASERLPLDQSRLQYSVSATLIPGWRLLAGLSHGFTPAQPLLVQAGLGFDLDSLGYTQTVGFARDRVDYLFAGRLSADGYQSIVPKSAIAVVSVSDLGITNQGTLGALLGLEAENRYLRFLRFLDRAANDPQLEAVVVKVEGAAVGLSRADEVRTALLNLRAHGKKVYAYILSAADQDYLMVSGADAIYAAPEAMMIVDGLRTSVNYFGGAAALLGVHVDVARVGAYKNFPDQFTRFDMSREQRETIEAYLDTSVKTVAGRILESRHLDGAHWQAALDEGLKSTRREKALGTIDDVLTPKQFEEVLRQKLPDARVDPNYRPTAERVERWGTPRKIAIVPVLGSITGGKSQVNPLGGELTTGAETFITAISAAAADPAVAAIVVRVDSGGGDGLASDLMYRAVLEARTKKPVITSMGDVAGSGGYYVAMGAEKIYASPTTLTGSIGVFFAKPALKGLAEKLGITQVDVQRGALAGISDDFQPWTPQQQVVAQKWVEDFYDSFITEVATSRKLTKEAVDAVARGRVWSGEDAKARGLVDELGGLMAAIDEAKRRAHLTDDDVALTITDGNATPWTSLVGAAAPSALLELKVPGPTVPPVLEALARQLGPSAWLLDPTPHVQARMEWTVELK